jgi:hypothetical protein
MLIGFQEVIDQLDKNNIDISGVFHIGAHNCEEIEFYNNSLGLSNQNIIWVDAINRKVIEAQNKGIPNVYNAVITDTDDSYIGFNVTNNVASSSVLELGTHAQEHPDVVYVEKVYQKSLTVDTFFDRNNLDYTKYNFWNIDIQGAELMALKGAPKAIRYAKALYLEVNEKELYKDCALIGDIDKFLLQYNFKRVITSMTHHGWGDALYVVDNNINIHVPINNNYAHGGRFANLFIVGMAMHFIAKKNNLKFAYKNHRKFKKLGVDWFVGENSYSSENTIDLLDTNFYDLIVNEKKLDSNISIVNNVWCQTKEFALLLKEYFDNDLQKTKILYSNLFKYRYNNNNDVFIHARLGDIANTNYIQPLSYYENALKLVTYENGYISSDTISHPICQELIKKYKLRVINYNEEETIMFSSTCKNVILSSGTFSWLIGLLGYYSNVYYPKINVKWHGDIFVFPDWVEVEY